MHSHQDHGAALAKILAEAGVPTVAHAITDGRDTPPQSAGDDLKRFTAALPPSVPVATVLGRYYAMDRDKRWERVAKAYDAIVEAEGPRFPDPQAAIADAYAKQQFDEFIVPAVIGDYRGIKDGDGVLCFNFRADRVREILGAMLDPDFSGFPRRRKIKFAAAVGMTQYSDATRQADAGDLRAADASATSSARSWPMPAARNCAWPRPRSIRTSPTSSTAAARSPIAGEDRIMVPSPKVATYDLQPEMSAPELTAKAVEAIDSGKYDLIVLNFANPDMVGHTGSLPAAIKAVEAADTGLGKIADAIAQAGRRAARHRRPRQLRVDARSGDRRPAHRAHHQPGAGAAGGRRRRHARGRPARRSRADHAGADGIAAAQGNDRRVADPEIDLTPSA